MLVLANAGVSRSPELYRGCEVIFKQPWKNSSLTVCYGTVLWWSCMQKGCPLPVQHYCVVPSVLLIHSGSSDVGVCISLSLGVTCLATKWAEEYCFIFQAHDAIRRQCFLPPFCTQNPGSGVSLTELFWLSSCYFCGSVEISVQTYQG